MATMSMQVRTKVVRVLVAEYRRAGRAYRGKLVEELCSVCGYECKYAIKVLTGNRPGLRGMRRGGGVRVYDEATERVVATIWKLADYPCGKRLAAVKKVKGETWAQFRERHGDWGRDLALWVAGAA